MNASGASITRTDSRVDVSAAVGHHEPLDVSITIVAPPSSRLPSRPFVVVAIPGGTYHRRYWDLRPPGRSGFSQTEHHAARGIVFVACDYLGGGDSTRPDDGDFIGLEAQADAAHRVFEVLDDVLAAYTPGLTRLDVRRADISPMYAALHDLPPALFTVGAADHLLDDSLLMSRRWEARGNDAELAAYPDCPHAFLGHPTELARRAATRIDEFIARCLRTS